MKYIIEFEDEPCVYEDGMKFYKCIQGSWWFLSERAIKQLTPYQPERKTGRWMEYIFSDGIMGRRPRALMCDQCNTLSLYRTNFCPNCGADMRGGDE